VGGTRLTWHVGLCLGGDSVINKCGGVPDRHTTWRAGRLAGIKGMVLLCGLMAVDYLGKVVVQDRAAGWSSLLSATCATVC
jgi:hypothetical protein